MIHLGFGSFSHLVNLSAPAWHLIYIPGTDLGSGTPQVPAPTDVLSPSLVSLRLQVRQYTLERSLLLEWIRKILKQTNASSCLRHLQLLCWTSLSSPARYATGLQLRNITTQYAPEFLSPVTYALQVASITDTMEYGLHVELLPRIYGS